MTVAVTIAPQPIQQVFVGGIPAAGGSILTQVGGVDYPTYEDQGVTPLPNPIPLNSRGEVSNASGLSCQLFLEQGVVYVFTYFDAQGNQFDQASYVATPDAVTQQSLGEIIYPQTPAEIAASVTPTFYIYSPSPLIDPRRYGVLGNGVTDDTAAMQTCLNIAYAQGGRIQIPEDFNMPIGNGAGAPNVGLSLTFTGTIGSNSLVIEGASDTGSVFTQNGSPPSLITFAGNSALAPTPANLTLANLGLVGVGKTFSGLLLQNLAYFVLDCVNSSAFTNGCALQSALIGVFRDCKFFSNNLGVIARAFAGGLADCNDVQFIGGVYNNNSTRAFDWGQGSNLKLDGCDIEGNGTSGGSAGVSGTTGAIILRASMTSLISQALADIVGCYLENNMGCGIETELAPGLFFSIRDTSILSSQNGNAIICGGCSSAILDNVSGDSASTLYFSAINPTTGAGTTGQLSLDGVTSHTISDAGVVYPNYGGYTTSAGSFSGFKVGSWPVVLTGCTTVPTGTLISHQQGKSVRLVMPTLTGTSNTTGCSIAAVVSTATGGTTTTLVDITQSWTVNQWAGFILYNSTNTDQAVILSNTATTLTFGAITANISTNAYQISAMPAQMYPPSNVYVPVVDQNSGSAESGYLQIATTGVMTFERNFAAFTNSGSKGSLACEPTYSCA